MAARSGAEDIAGLDICGTAHIERGVGRVLLASARELPAVQEKLAAHELYEYLCRTAPDALFDVPMDLWSRAHAARPHERETNSVRFRLICLERTPAGDTLVAFGTCAPAGTKSSRFQDDEVAALKNLAAALALRTAMERSFRGCVVTDALGSVKRSSLADARRFVALELKRAQREGYELSVALLLAARLGPCESPDDLDALFPDISDLISNTVRRSDVVVSVGASRFVVVMPQTSARDALIAVHRINEGFASRPFAARGRHLDVRLTAGIAGFVPSNPASQDLLAEANLALSEAVSAGPGAAFIHV